MDERKDRQTDRHDEANSRFSKFCEPVPNKEAHVIRQTSRLTRWDTIILSTHQAVEPLTLRLLMSYIYGAPTLDVSRSHTTTQHSR